MLCDSCLFHFSEVPLSVYMIFFLSQLSFVLAFLCFACKENYKLYLMRGNNGAKVWDFFCQNCFFIFEGGNWNYGFCICVISGNGIREFFPIFMRWVFRRWNIIGLVLKYLVGLIWHSVHVAGCLVQFIRTPMEWEPLN